MKAEEEAEEMLKHPLSFSEAEAQVKRLNEQQSNSSTMKETAEEKECFAIIKQVAALNKENDPLKYYNDLVTVGLAIKAMEAYRKQGEDGYKIIKGDEVNSFLAAILMRLTTEQMEALRDCLISRTPKQGNLPTDAETESWFVDNIGITNDCCASSAIYKFRLWLKDRKPKQGEAELLKSLKEAEYLLSGEPSEENVYEAHNMIEEIINNLESHRKLSAENKAFKELAAFIIRAHQTVFINADISKESKKEILHHFNISSNILD